MNIALYNQDVMSTIFKWTQEFTPAQVCKRWKTIFDTVRENISKQILSDIEKGLGEEKFHKLKNRIRVLPAISLLKALFRDLADEKANANISKVPSAADYLALNQDLDDEENIRFSSKLPLGEEFLSRPHIQNLSPREKAIQLKQRLKDDQLLIELKRLSYSAKTRCPTLLFKLTNLTHLNLNNGGIKSIPPKFSRLTSLCILSLKNNPLIHHKAEIENLKNIITKFRNLRDLDLYEHHGFNEPIKVIEKFFKKDIESGVPLQPSVDEEVTSLLRGSLRTKEWCSGICVMVSFMTAACIGAVLFSIIYLAIAFK